MMHVILLFLQASVVIIRNAALSAGINTVQLLDNPKTMDRAHVLRSLELRHLNNASDITTMLLFTILLAGLFFGVITWLLYKQNKPFSFVFGAVVTICLVTICIGFMSFLDGGRLAVPSFSFTILHFFYFCDGVIILLAYSFSLSYEEANLALFLLLQPTIIVGLLFWIWHLQRKLSRDGALVSTNGKKEFYN